MDSQTKMDLTPGRKPSNLMLSRKISGESFFESPWVYFLCPLAHFNEDSPKLERPPAEAVFAFHINIRVRSLFRRKLHFDKIGPVDLYGLSPGRREEKAPVRLVYIIGAAKPKRAAIGKGHQRT